MASNKKSDKKRKKSLKNISEKGKVNDKIAAVINSALPLEEKALMENSRVLENNSDLDSQIISQDVNFVVGEKTWLQKRLELLQDPIIYAMPDFLVEKFKGKERKEVFKKFNSLLKYRFSLVTIADILETNDYDQLDEVIERKHKFYKLIEQYTSSESTSKKPKFLSNFKKTVGEKYSKVYLEQEEKTKATIKLLSDGKYFKKGADEEKNSLEIEDIISNLIDTKDFNLACQIETEFLNYELNRIIKMLSDLQLRSELNDLIEELIDISEKFEERAHAYDVMDRLISGENDSRKIVKGKGER